MKATGLAVCVVVGLVIGGFCFAADAPDAKALVGTIVKVSDEKLAVKVGEKEVTVTTDKNTKVTVDGKDAKVSDLKATMTVSVTPADGVAQKIDAKSARRG